MISVLTLGLLASPLAAQAVAPGPDALAIWDFAEGAGDVLADGSGNGHDGRIVKATWIHGPFGAALRFDGRGHYVRVADAPGLRLQAPYTLGVWFRTTSSDNNGVFLLSKGTDYAYGLYLYGDSLAVDHYAKAGDGTIFNSGYSSRAIPDGTWHHLVGTIEPGRFRTYLDGELRGERPLPEDLTIRHPSEPGPAGDLFLGCWFGAGHLTGAMGKAYILGRALDEAEVKALHDDERERFGRSVRISPAAARPDVDGRLDDPAWQGQPALSHFTLNDYEATPAAKQTTVRLAYDDENLYVAVRCEEPDMAGLSAGQTGRDGTSLWKDDCIELFLAARPGAYHQFLLTAGNALIDLRYTYEIGEDGYVIGGYSEFKSDATWNCRGFRSATARGEAHWTAEVSIPFAAIGFAAQPGATLRFNIAREETQLKELSTLSPLFGMFHQPEAFSTLDFHQDSALMSRAPKQFVTLDETPGIAEARAWDAQARGPVVFTTHYLARGYPTTVPTPEQRAGPMRIFATPGEYEPAAFAVRAAAAKLEGVTVRLATDLRGDTGARISRAHVDIRTVEQWERWNTSRKFMWMERYLLPLTAVDVPRHTTRRFWLTLHVPDDATADTYRGTVRIEHAGAALGTIDLEAEVLPFVLPRADDVGYFMYLPAWGVPRRLRTRPYLEKIFADMRAHGMTTATLYMFPFADVDGAYRFTLDHPGRNYGEFPVRMSMEAIVNSGFLGPELPVIWVGADTVDPGTWKLILDEARANAWPEIVLYLQDEPGDAERQANAKRLFEVLADFKEQHPEYRDVRTTTAIGSGIETLGHLYDIWIAGELNVSNGSISPKLAAEKGNRTLWSYSCSLAPVDAETSRYYFGFWCWKSDVKGASFWAYSDWQNNAGKLDWDYIGANLAHMELTYSFVFPHADGPVPSVAWEAVREGIDDNRYVNLLTRLIEEAKAVGSALADDAERVLDDVGAQIHVEALWQAMKKGEASGRRMGAWYDRPPPEPALSPAGYDQLRYRIAQEILKLNKALRI